LDDDFVTALPKVLDGLLFCVAGSGVAPGKVHHLGEGRE
jgi:hypothetical protein